MHTFNLRLKVLSRTVIKYEKYLNVFFSAEFFPEYTLKPPSFYLNPFQFTPLPLRNHTEQARKYLEERKEKQTILLYLPQSESLVSKCLTINKSQLKGKLKKNFQLKLLCTSPWAHFPPSFPEITTLLTCVSIIPILDIDYLISSTCDCFYKTKLYKPKAVCIWYCPLCSI